MVTVSIFMQFWRVSQDYYEKNLVPNSGPNFGGAFYT